MSVTEREAMSVQDKIDKAINALINAGKPPNHESPEPTKEDLERKFVMRVDRKGKPTIKEVK